MKDIPVGNSSGICGLVMLLLRPWLTIPRVESPSYFAMSTFRQCLETGRSLGQPMFSKRAENTIEP
jgi:hypothetical protein